MKQIFMCDKYTYNVKLISFISYYLNFYQHLCNRNYFTFKSQNLEKKIKLMFNNL